MKTVVSEQAMAAESPASQGEPRPVAEPAGCCSPVKQATCCEPSEKASCCGQASSSGGCGCQ
jgi:hypothetical protein